MSVLGGQRIVLGRELASSRKSADILYGTHIKLMIMSDDEVGPPPVEQKRGG